MWVQVWVGVSRGWRVWMWGLSVLLGLTTTIVLFYSHLPQVGVSGWVGGWVYHGGVEFGVWIRAWACVLWGW